MRFLFSVLMGSLLIRWNFLGFLVMFGYLSEVVVVMMVMFLLVMVILSGRLVNFLVDFSFWSF